MEDKDIEKMAKVYGIFRQPDHDSFASFTGGLRNNWVFVMAVVAIAWWIINSVTNAQNINVIQDSKIESTVKAITDLTSNVNNLTNQVQTNVRTSDAANNEIVRRLDLVQKDIDIIKSQK